MRVSSRILEGMEKVGAFFKGLDRKQYYYVFGGFLLVLFLLDYFVVMGPQLKSLADISTKIRTKNEDIDRTQNDILRLNDFRKQIDILKNDVNQLQSRVKPRDEVSQVLERITLIGNQSDIVIDQIMPNVLEEEKLLETGDKIYYSLPISIEARCGYHEFGRFLNDIENDGIFFNILSFTVSAEKDSPTHRIRLIVNTVIYEKNGKDS